MLIEPPEDLDELFSTSSVFDESPLVKIDLLSKRIVSAIIRITPGDCLFTRV